jgi:hypothetical protein
MAVMVRIGKQEKKGNYGMMMKIGDCLWFFPEELKS